MTIKDLTNNKSVLFGLIVVVIVILIAIFSGGRINNPTAITPNPSYKTSGLQITNLNEEKKQRATEYRSSIANKLPIHVNEFKTSVGITTNIDITALSGDDPATVNLAINGLSYLSRESDFKKNPNAKAYADSYHEAMRLLREKGIDPTRLIFTYGDRDFVQATTAVWIDTLKLKP